MLVHGQAWGQAPSLQQQLFGAGVQLVDRRFKRFPLQGVFVGRVSKVLAISAMACGSWPATI